MKMIRTIVLTLASLLIFSLGNAQNISFALSQGSPIPVGPNPLGMASGDFNKDGSLDMAIGNYGSNTVTILLGHGDGTFINAPGSPFTGNSGPICIVTADFDNDGVLDLATADFFSGSISIYKGAGDGTFALLGRPLQSLAHPFFISLGDFNGDGKPDLAECNASDNSVNVLLGNGNCTFNLSSGSPMTVGQSPFCVAIGDFNNDSKLDLITVNGGGGKNAGSLTILSGNGDGSFSPGTTLKIGLQLRQASVADFNHDGNLDLAVTDLQANNLFVLLGDGTGAFANAAGSPIATGAFPYWSVASDFDQNGKIDLAVTNGSDNIIEIFSGNGDGTFATATTINNAGNPRGIIVANDFNGDGQSDLAVANLDSSNVNILLNTSLPPSPGSTCGTASHLGSNLCLTNQTYTGTDFWYSFIATAPGQDIRVKNNATSTDFISKIQVYGGTCGALQTISSSSPYNSADSSVIVQLLNLAVGNSYLCRITSQGLAGTNPNYSICSWATVPSCTSTPINCELVMNGGFEDRDISDYPSCNYTINDDVWPFGASCWYNPCSIPPSGSGFYYSSPDYFNSCSNGVGTTGTNVGVPLNCQTNGAVVDHTLQPPSALTFGYIGLVVYTKPGADAGLDLHEYIQQQLRAPLTANTVYNVSMWVYLSDQSAWACDGLGVAFSNTEFLQVPPYVNTPDLPTTSGTAVYTQALITTIMGWTQISGTYTAVGGESYFEIGNLLTNPGGTGYGPPYTHPQANNPVGIGDFAYYFIDDVSITEIPNLSLTGNTSICSGCQDGPAELDAFVNNGTAPYSYSWVPNTSLLPPSGTGSQVEACPGSTTTYIVTEVDAVGCPTNGMVTVTVNPVPTLSISATLTSICLGQTSNIAASLTNTPTISGVTYSWSPAAGLNITTGLNVSATPLVTTTYTVTATSPSGCSGTAIITINVASDHCCIPSQNAGAAYGSFTFGLASAPLPFQSNAVSNATYDIAPGAVITIPAGTFNLNNVILRMGAGASINIQPNGVLNVTNQSHLFSCQDLWQGIVMQKSSVLNFNTDSWLEDAIIGVESMSGARFTINTGIFNRNYIDVQCDATSTHPGTIVNSAFSCRDIPLFPVPMVATLTSQLASLPKLKLQGSNGTGFYSTVRTQVGVLLKTVSTITIGPASAAAGPNWFDDMEYGIWLQQSGATIQNNQFQDMEGKYQFHIPVSFFTGIAIYGQATSTAPSLAINAIDNGVNDCYRGIDLRGDYKSISLIHNAVNVSKTYYTVPGSGLYIGAIGFYLSPGSVSTINVTRNNVTNCITGMMQDKRSSVIGSSTTYSDNNLSASGGVGYCNTAMSFSDPSAVVSNQSFTVNGNRISQAKNGIYVMNLTGTVPFSPQSYLFSQNLCGLIYQTSGAGEGMKFAGCKYLEVNNNHSKCDPAAALLTGNQSIYGIHLQASTFMYVHCNLVENVGRGMVFEGTCTSMSHYSNGISTGSGILENTMRSAQDGFVLTTNGVIGRQGVPISHLNPLGIASNNYWDMTGGVFGTFSNNETNVLNTTTANTLSPLCNSGQPAGPQATLPVNNAGFVGIAYKQTALVHGLPRANGLLASCGPVPFKVDNSSSGADSLFSSDLEKMVKDSSLLPVFSTESHTFQKLAVFDMLDRDNTLFERNEILSDFFSKESNGNTRKFKEVDEEISEQKYSHAKSINNSIHPTNTMEANQKQFNSLYLNMLLNPSALDSSAVAQFTQIANTCPLSAGNSVYQARAILFQVYGQVQDFTDNCGSTGRTDFPQPITGLNHNSANYAIKLYPNPNDGNMMFEYQLGQGERGVLSIFDMAGNEVLNRSLTENSSSQKINLPELQNGIYIYHFEANGKNVKSGKLVIIK